LKTVDINSAEGSFTKYAKQASRAPVIVTSRGKPFVAIVDISDMDEESLSLSTNPKFLDILKRSRQRLAKEGGISIEQVRRRFGLPAKSPAKSRRRPSS
jgi:prevent-host-death family protein